ncbi:hypothetical protein SLA2020_209980 [Shorea laevis]
MVVPNGKTNPVEEDLGLLLNNIHLFVGEGREVSLVQEWNSLINNKEDFCLHGKVLTKKRINLMGITSAMNLS